MIGNRQKPTRMPRCGSAHTAKRHRAAHHPGQRARDDHIEAEPDPPGERGGSTTVTADVRSCRALDVLDGDLQPWTESHNSFGVPIRRALGPAKAVSAVVDFHTTFAANRESTAANVPLLSARGQQSAMSRRTQYRHQASTSTNAVSPDLQNGIHGPDIKVTTAADRGRTVDVLGFGRVLFKGGTNATVCAP